MSDNEQIKLNYIIQKLEAQDKKLDSIHRGVYGDPENKVLGLIDRQESDERRIKTLEDDKKKAIWIGTGFVAAMQAIGMTLWEFFKKS